MTSSDCDCGVQQLVQEMKREFPRFRIVSKSDSRLSKAIDVCLRLITAGSQNRYMTHYHTVLGDTLYVPLSWQDAAEVDKLIVLRHERVHLRQRRRYGLVGMALLYLLPILPLGLAFGRARIEWEAYSETLRATAELKGMQAARDPALREHIVRQFTSGAYGWMWPFPKAVERWYDEVLRGIELSWGSRELRSSHMQGPS